MGIPHLGYCNVFVNPEIVETSEETEDMLEGCLSIPGVVDKVKRHTQVTVEYKNLRGEPRRYTSEHRHIAQCLQHEIEHLDGMLFVDKLIEEVKECLIK